MDGSLDGFLIYICNPWQKQKAYCNFNDCKATKCFLNYYYSNSLLVRSGFPKRPIKLRARAIEPEQKISNSRNSGNNLGSINWMSNRLRRSRTNTELSLENSQLILNAGKSLLNEPTICSIVL